MQGFGEQVLGETWVGHYGSNHEQSSRVIALEERLDHPILRGVADMHVQSGGYQAYPPDDAAILATGLVLLGYNAFRASPAEAPYVTGVLLLLFLAGFAFVLILFSLLPSLDSRSD